MAIWLELRVTMGHPFRPADENRVATLIEETVDVPARRVFFQSEDNFSWTFVRFDEARISYDRLTFFQRELARAFDDVVGISLDEVNIVDLQEVAEFLPGVV